MNKEQLEALDKAAMEISGMSQEEFSEAMGRDYPANGESVQMDNSASIQLTFKPIDLVKLDLKSGDTLAMIIKSNDIDGATLGHLKTNLKEQFPNNKVLIFGIGLSDNIQFSVIAENKEISTCATSNYCVDCSCGKKEKV